MQTKPLKIVTTSTSVKTKIRRTAVQWRELMKVYEDSGLSQQAFCQQQGIALSTFYSWRNKLSEQSELGNHRSTEQNPFIALTPPKAQTQNESQDWDVELAFANGMTIRLRT